MLSDLIFCEADGCEVVSHYAFKCISLITSVVKNLFIDFFFGNTFAHLLDFPGGSDDKESACNVGDLDLIPGLGRSPGEGNGYPLQYSDLENYMDRRA